MSIQIAHLEVQIRMAARFPDRGESVENNCSCFEEDLTNPA